MAVKVASYLCLVVPATALSGLWTAARPAVLAPCHASRAPPPCARNGDSDEPRVDFDESGEQCVVSEAGSSCIEVDISEAIPLDGVDEERRRRSPGLWNNFYDMSTADFKKPFDAARGSGFPSFSGGEDGSINVPSPWDEVMRRSPGIQRNFWDMSTEDFKKPFVTPNGAAPVEVGSSVTSGFQAPAGFGAETPISAPAEVTGLKTRVTQLEQSNAQLKASLSEMRARLKALEGEA